jgi:hypothetical protein
MTDEEKTRLKDSEQTTEILEQEEEKEKYGVWDEETQSYKGVPLDDFIKAYKNQSDLEKRTLQSSHRQEIEQEKLKQKQLLEALTQQRQQMQMYLPQQQEEQEEDTSELYKPLEDFQPIMQLPALQSIFQMQLGQGEEQSFRDGGEKSCPQGYHWDEESQECVSNFFQQKPTNKTIDPLDKTKKEAAVNTLKNPPKTKTSNEIQKIDSNSSIPKVQHIETSLDKPFSLAGKLKEFDNQVQSLVSSGDAARLLRDKYFDKNNTKSLEQLTREALTSDPDFLKKIESDKLREFKENEQKAYDEANIIQKAANTTSAFLADPILTGANLMSGERPLMGQSGALRDEANPNQRFYQQMTGADQNVLNDFFNIFLIYFKFNIFTFTH